MESGTTPHLPRPRNTQGPANRQRLLPGRWPSQQRCPGRAQHLLTWQREWRSPEWGYLQNMKRESGERHSQQTRCLQVHGCQYIQVNQHTHVCVCICVCVHSGLTLPILPGLDHPCPHVWCWAQAFRAQILPKKLLVSQRRWSQKPDKYRGLRG